MIPTWLPLLIGGLPLVAAFGTGLLPRKAASAAHLVAAAILSLATALAAWQAWSVVAEHAVIAGPHATWLDVGAFTLGVGVFVDSMGAVMALIVCTLATAVLVFNRWYMHDDPMAGRFPWQFCGFVFAMLGVVLSDNLFLTFCCWELVGLGSYLLIGFWWHKPAASDDAAYQAMKHRGARGVLEASLSPAHAQLKAFVMNRVGDAGFLLGIGALLAIGVQTGKGGALLSFSELGALAQDPALAEVLFLDLSGQDLLLLAALGVFAGAIGKSAQFPLHGWLPDAMQGPTTASSIIHAATMVAAGVFLVARAYPLFPPDALAVVGWTGGITCLLAASIACVQWDLKAVLAYSTVSQLGLMFVALGAGEIAGGRAAAIAHLFTHAFFKCLLFLCAGSVIHACAGHQDLHRMGGLRKPMPVVAWTSLAAVLAIVGAPLFAGFYSKDAVLAAALALAQTEGGAAWGPFLLAATGSLLTAAYMLRWWFKIFLGSERDAKVTHHAHDPAGAAKVVLIALAPFTLALPWIFGDWLDGALAFSRALPDAAHRDILHGAHSTAMIVALALLALGGSFAVVVYARGALAATAGEHTLAVELARRFAVLHRACAELWGIDRLWFNVFVRGVGQRGAAVSARLDLGSAQRLQEVGGGRTALSDWLSLDGLVDGVGRVCSRLGSGGALAHSGRLGVYLAAAVVASALALWWGLSG